VDDQVFDGVVFGFEVDALEGRRVDCALEPHRLDFVSVEVKVGEFDLLVDVGVAGEGSAVRNGDFVAGLVVEHF